MGSLGKRSWREFRRTHIGVQVLCWAVWAVLVLGVVGAATGAGKEKRASATVEPTSESSSTVTTTTERHPEVTVIGQLDLDHPSSTLTPGATFAGVTAEQVCVAGYSASVRDVPASVRDQVFAEYGLTDADRSQYEVDHLISLELGGSNELANLWPEPLNGIDGAKDKDTIENRLHDLVCSGQVALTDAQAAIVHWDTVNVTALASTTTTTTEPPTTTVPPTTLPPVTAPRATVAPPPPPTIAAPVPDCTPGYDPCIPQGSDVDCAGGSGNGPRYVRGPVQVTGSDPYGLDSDHDGVGCES